MTERSVGRPSEQLKVGDKISIRHIPTKWEKLLSFVGIKPREVNNYIVTTTLHGQDGRPVNWLYGSLEEHHE